MAPDALPTNETGESSVVVRFSDVEIPDLSLNVNNIPLQEINTKWLRTMCRQLRGRFTNGRRLKFIRNGRMLNSHSDLRLEEYFDAGSPQFYVHCIVGQELSRDELSREDALDDAVQNTEGTTTQAIGFDRLRSVGFSDEEIELLRQQFRTTYGDLDELSRTNGNEARDIRQLEEQWMETGANEEDSRISSVTIADYKHNVDLLIGLTVGCVLGVFSLLLFKQEGLFNKRQKMAIIGGLLFNFMFGILRRY
ncbi:LAMI_0H06106g1_1 [Lachancea mirantina]|uniref:LAMI_0H06106g1_1 n=1 Tax=Lachancea mirantina TaxID=1230905 RepID=A0A1G4KFC2_9SACH|nr:LAMI_0H06106g1_1 [Lachancea mirantina]